MNNRENNMTQGILRMLLICGIIMLAGCDEQTSGEMQPSGFNSFRDSQTGLTRSSFGDMVIENYLDSTGQWQTIDTNWVEIDEETWVCGTDFITAIAHANGTVEVIFDTITIAQQLHDISRRDTTYFTAHNTYVTNLEWPTPTVSGRDVTWSFEEGFKVIARKAPGGCSYIVEYDSLFLADYVYPDISWMDTPLLGRQTLSSVCEYWIDGISLDSFVVDSLSTYKALWHQGSKGVLMQPQLLHFEGWEDATLVPIYQYWFERKTDFYGEEYFRMSSFKSLWLSGVYSMWHATDVRIESINEDDMYISDPVRNRTKAYFQCSVNYAGHSSSGSIGDCKSLFIFWNVDSLVGANDVISCSLQVGIDTTCCDTDSFEVALFDISKPNNRGTYFSGNCCGCDPDSGTTWLDWSETAYEWGSAGASATADPCADNSTDGGGCDHSTDPMDEVWFNVTDGGFDGWSSWFGFEADTARINGWLSDGDPVRLMLEGQDLIGGLTQQHIQIRDNAYPWTPNSPPPTTVRLICWYYQKSAGQTIIIGGDD
jgi:hypothetical protein